MESVFITGATGYMGRHLIPRLLERGHRVRGLVRPGSETKLVGGEAVGGDVLNPKDYPLSKQDTVVHLAGTPHPGPNKGPQFRAFDLPSILAASEAAAQASIKHFVYLSVAHPAPRDARLHRRPDGWRARVGAIRNSPDDPAPLVRARSGALVALCSKAILLAGSAGADTSRGSAPLRSGDHRADERRPGSGH